MEVKFPFRFKLCTSFGGWLHAIITYGEEHHTYFEEETKWVLILSELFKGEKNRLLLTVIYNIMTVICTEKCFRRQFRHII